MRDTVVILVICMIALAACRDRNGDDASPTPASLDPAASASPGATSATTADAAPSTEVTDPPDGPTGASELTLDVDGLERTARLYVPEVLSGEVPLVIGMHGGFGSGEQFARSSGFDDLAVAEGFIAVYPNGEGAIPTWNGGRCCGFAAREDVDDVAFVAALIDAIAARYPVDLARVYALGHSNGGIMSLRLACELADRIAAVGAVAGSLETGECEPSRPLSVVIIHGDADLNHPLEGGRGSQSVSQVDFTSVDDSLDLIRPAMGCSDESRGVYPYARYHIITWFCADGTSVELQVIEGGPHGWPGGSGIGSDPDSPVDATQALWEFLSPYAITSP